MFSSLNKASILVQRRHIRTLTTSLEHIHTHTHKLPPTHHKNHKYIITTGKAPHKSALPSQTIDVVLNLIPVVDDAFEFVYVSLYNSVHSYCAANMTYA